MARFLFIEPFYGGSHKYFADALIRESRHHIDIYTFPARFWKWRMRSAAVYAVQQVKNLHSYDAIITSNMLSLCDLKALGGPSLPPLILYFHENQILYPLGEGEDEDLHYGFTDYTSALCADDIIFNSRYHRDAFLDSLPAFLSRFPDYKPDSSINEIRSKSTIIHPGCYLEKLPQIPFGRPSEPVILWNHRWEHDKNPEEFFEICFTLADEDIPFKLAVLGEQFAKSPSIFSIAEKRLKERIIHFGYAEDYEVYKRMLNRGDIVISTSFQENFGISVVEAIGSGNFPLLPDRLSYREIIPEEFHKLCIYKNRNDLLKKLRKLIRHYDPRLVHRLVEKNKKFGWDKIILQFDNYLDQKKIP